MLFFIDEDIENLAIPFHFALIGKFSRRPSLSEIHATYNSIGFRSTFNIGLLDKKHILIWFGHEDDYYRCWLRDKWFIKCFPMRVFNWSPSFRVMLNNQ